MAIKQRQISTALVAAAAMIACGGCSKSFTARRYPAFYDPNLRTVAVLPFQNDTGVQGAGRLAADTLAAALRANGTYKVFTPHALQMLIAQKKLAGLSRTDRQRDAKELAQLEGIQAFITGTVLPGSAIHGLYPPAGRRRPYHPAVNVQNGRGRYEFINDEDQEGNEGFEEDPGDPFDDFYDPSYYPYWYWDYPDAYSPEYYTEAYVSLEAAMVRVSDGTTLYETAVPIQARADLRSSRRIAPASATLDVMHRAAVKLVDELAVVSTQITPEGGLKTAVGKTGRQWTFSNTFRLSDQTMYVVIQLPASVAHDTFRLTITPKGQPDDVVAAKDFTWPPGQTTVAVSFSPHEIANNTGTGRYTVTFHSMAKSVMQHNFTIK
jgi:hypothetical protein